MGNAFSLVHEYKHSSIECVNHPVLLPLISKNTSSQLTLMLTFIAT